MLVRDYAEGTLCYGDSYCVKCTSSKDSHPCVYGSVYRLCGCQLRDSSCNVNWAAVSAAGVLTFYRDDMHFKIEPVHCQSFKFCLCINVRWPIVQNVTFRSYFAPCFAPHASGGNRLWLGDWVRREMIREALHIGTFAKLAFWCVPSWESFAVKIGVRDFANSKYCTKPNSELKNTFTKVRHSYSSALKCTFAKTRWANNNEISFAALHTQLLQVSIDRENTMAVAFFAPETTTRHGVNQQPRGAWHLGSRVQWYGWGSSLKVYFS